MVNSQIAFLSVALFATLVVFCGVGALDPNTVDIATRRNWCTNQVATCTLICKDGGSGVLSNTCDPTNLSYDCRCSNGLAPNASEYTQTIPYFECTYDVDACTKACPTADQTCIAGCQKNCTAEHPKVAGATPPQTLTSSSVATPSSTNGPAPNNYFNSANRLPQSVINGSFVIFLTAVMVFFGRL
ncbi:9102_t:CDS:2 [Paraglomus brasilianum]|uniref:9102_t:CDS:1 n=1 Tax=Paraglomus brasilianum TaxID=144538 RepID=A0A9N9FZA0_9GLOM|nr:9102_t:CDS:2 [Paraglomus brasilianum]